jgi:hypothetical protein
VQLRQLPNPRGAVGLCPDHDSERVGAVHGIAQRRYRKVGAQVSDRGGALGQRRVQRFQRARQRRDQHRYFTHFIECSVVG